MSNPDQDHDHHAEMAIIADLETIDEFKADARALLEAFRALVRRECEVGLVDRDALTAIRTFQEKHPSFRP